MKGAVAAPTGFADVVWFDVSMGDPLSFQDDDGFMQVFAEPLKQVQRKAPFLFDALRKRLVARQVEHDCSSVAHRRRAVIANDQGAVELLKDFSFIAYAVVVIGVDRDLQHELSVFLFDKQRRWKAIVRADGSIVSGGEVGSIHGVGKALQDAPSCNGWTFWHLEHEGQARPIDSLRQLYLLAVED